ncbi:Cytochrome c oxidase subunit II [Azospirillaceae bacterium]
MTKRCCCSSQTACGVSEKKKACRGRRGVGIGLAVVSAVFLAAMPAWRGMPRAKFQEYLIAQPDFDARLNEMIVKHQVGEEEGVPVVRPPPGDVYLAAERWRFRPIIELQAGKDYRIHVSGYDILHGVVIAGQEALLSPGRAAVLSVTAPQQGRVSVQCSEYCGLEHNKMRNWMNVVETP